MPDTPRTAADAGLNFLALIDGPAPEPTEYDRMVDAAADYDRRATAAFARGAFGTYEHLTFMRGVALRRAETLR